MTAYFDQAAAARPAPEVLAYHGEMLRRYFANQEAAHQLGYELRRELDRAAAELAFALTGRDGFRVIWGMTGTELFNLLADSPLTAGRAVLTSRLEHPALAAALRRSAATVDCLRTDSHGRLTPAEKTDARLAAFHHVQSEIGVLQQLDAVFESAPRAVRFVDAIQSAGKLNLPETFDIAAVSGHKFGAPGGAALLLAPEFAGAAGLLDFAHAYRHNGYRAGRPEAPMLLTLAFAARQCAAQRETTLARIGQLNAQLRGALDGLPLPGGGRLSFTVPAESASPFILHVMLPGLQAGVAVRMLADAGVMTAAGSACAAESREPSAVLTALGFRRDDAYSGLRISLGADSTEEEVKKLVEALQSVLKNY